MTSAPDAGDVRSWTFAGVLVAREVLGPDHELAARLNEYVLATTGGEEARDRETAEWWAAVATINPALDPNEDGS